MDNVRILFLCDGKKGKCRNSLRCYWQNRGVCRHTTDPRHSRNFDPLSEEGLVEMDESGKFVVGLCEGVITFEEQEEASPDGKNHRRGIELDGETYDYPIPNGDVDILRETVERQLLEWTDLEASGLTEKPAADIFSPYSSLRRRYEHMVEDNKKYEKMACRIVIVVLAAMFGLILNAFALASNDTSLGWVFFLAVPAGAVDVAMLLATFKLMYKLDKGEDI